MTVELMISKHNLVLANPIKKFTNDDIKFMIKFLSFKKDSKNKFYTSNNKYIGKRSMLSLMGTIESGDYICLIMDNIVSALYMKITDVFWILLAEEKI